MKLKDLLRRSKTEKSEQDTVNENIETVPSTATERRLNLVRLAVAVLIGLLVLGSGIIGKIQDGIASKIRGEATKAELITDVETLKITRREDNERLARIEALLSGLDQRVKNTQDDIGSIRDRLLKNEELSARSMQENIQLGGQVRQMERVDATHTQIMTAIVNSALSKPLPVPVVTPTPSPTPTPKHGFFHKVFGHEDKKQEK